jgi:hypothetical protein
MPIRGSESARGAGGEGGRNTSAYNSADAAHGPEGTLSHSTGWTREHTLLFYRLDQRAHSLIPQAGTEGTLSNPTG